MDDINNYFNKNFDNLPLSHQNFIAGSYNETYKGPQLSGKNINSKYKLLHFYFEPFYKPITTFLI
jgi:hypothetical protein